MENKTILKFEVEKGTTVCTYDRCPLYNLEGVCTKMFGVDCNKYNLATLKLIEEDEEETKE